MNAAFTGYRFFRSQAFSYQALRTMGHASACGATAVECLLTFRRIKDGDAESWYSAWSARAEACEKLHVMEGDVTSRGRALLRASNYHRASGFFLPADDQRHQEIHRRQADAFERGLKTIGIPHKSWNIPYERYSLRAYYFPGDAKKPLVIACGGFDSTLEELFFWIGNAAVERGHPCIMFEGPGQSGMLREYGTVFIPEWEKPLMAVLDHARWDSPETDGCVKVLVGVSMGGMLALRAASRDKRINAAACHCGFFSMENAALMRLPSPAKWAYRMGMRGVFNRLASIAAARDKERRWALGHGMKVTGAATPFDFLARASEFSLLSVAEDITCDVLVVQASRDHLVPTRDVDLFRKHLKRARSLKLVTIEDPGGEHCQAGAVETFHQVLFGWIGGLYTPLAR